MVELENINNNIDIAIGEIKRAESFFNKAKESLNKAITKRLENEKLTGIMTLRRTNVSLLVNLSKDDALKGCRKCFRTGVKFFFEDDR